MLNVVRWVLTPGPKHSGAGRVIVLNKTGSWVLKCFVKRVLSKSRTGVFIGNQRAAI